MRLAEIVYRRIASIKGGDDVNIEKRQLLRLRKLMLLFGDPEVGMPVGALQLKMRLSHNQPHLRANNPFYDEVIGRLVAAIEADLGPLCMVDVGANVGDTAALVYAGDPRKFFCIEGDPRHFAFLKGNLGGKSNVQCECLILSDKSGEKLSFNESQGTSHVSLGQADAGLTTTLDEAVGAYPAFASCNLLKVDTDGYDLKILRGAKRLLARAKPVLLVELSPRHYRAVGAEAPDEFWDLLLGSGYQYVVIYTSRGVLMGATDIEGIVARNFLRDLIRHADFEGRYYDVVAFPSNAKPLFEIFSFSERALFCPPSVGSFKV